MCTYKYTWLALNSLTSHLLCYAHINVAGRALNVPTIGNTRSEFSAYFSYSHRREMAILNWDVKSKKLVIKTECSSFFSFALILEDFCDFGQGLPGSATYTPY